MNKAFTQIGKFCLIVIVTGILALLLAYPLKWTWNYVMPYLFDFKTITWAHAWCLSWIAGSLVKSNLSHNSTS